MKPVYVVVFMLGMLSYPLAQEAFKPRQKEANQTAVHHPKKVVQMKVTAYCPCAKCCGKYADGKTATGRNAFEPGVAADPKLLPYKTPLNIPGIGILVVDDTGGAMRQAGKLGIYHIDVRFPTHQQALNWGVKNLPVEILN